jgi:hypothetical protein
MIALVTLEQVKARLKVDGTDDDANLQGLIYGASRMVLNYLELDEDHYLNSDGAMDIDTDTQGYFEVPEEIQVATIMLVGALYRDPDGSESEKWSRGFLPNPVVAILYPHRDPTI